MQIDDEKPGWTPLEGRHCGTCTACCSFAPIREPALRKPANTLCLHCAEGRGCTVYDIRPQVCRGFYCGYFFLPELGQHWHPEQSGVVIRSESFDRDTITILVLRLSPFLVSEDFAGLVGAWIEAGLDVEFERVGPEGHLPAKMKVNDFLGDAIATRDLREMQKVFAWSLAYIDQNHTWERDETVFESNLV